MCYFGHYSVLFRAPAAVRHVQPFDQPALVLLRPPRDDLSPLDGEPSPFTPHLLLILHHPLGVQDLGFTAL
eukprot:355495-Rhodomonas_salina.1